MAYTYALINKATLAHICTGKKVSEEYIVSKTGLMPTKVKLWLNPEEPSLPTINQAKQIATCLHVPFAGLYMNPADVKIKAIPSIKNYRTIYGTSVADDSPLNIAIIDLLRERDFLMDASEEMDISLPAFCMSITMPEDHIKWAREIRRLFDIRLESQYRCTSPRKFYLYLREKIEAAGIFVHCYTDVPLETARGLAIYDPAMPIIGLNDEDRQPAKSFSMIHELVHIFKRESSLCNDLRSVRKEEIFCNAVAGEVLVPREALDSVLKAKEICRPFTKHAIEQLAQKFSVSKEVIIRRLLDAGKISIAEHDIYANEFRRDVELQREEQRIARKEGRRVPGPPREVSREAIDRTSASVCRTLYRGYGNELFSKQDVARHLGISQKHVNKFLTEVSTWKR